VTVVCWRGAGDYTNTDEVYEDITNAAALKKKMLDLLVEYNNSPGVVQMDLVLFRDAIDHGIYRDYSRRQGTVISGVCQSVRL